MSERYYGEITMNSDGTFCAILSVEIPSEFDQNGSIGRTVKSRDDFKTEHQAEWWLKETKARHIAREKYGTKVVEL